MVLSMENRSCQRSTFFSLSRTRNRQSTVRVSVRKSGVVWCMRVCVCVSNFRLKQHISNTCTDIHTRLGSNISSTTSAMWPQPPSLASGSSSLKWESQPHSPWHGAWVWRLSKAENGKSLHPVGKGEVSLSFRGVQKGVLYFLFSHIL